MRSEGDKYTAFVVSSPRDRGFTLIELLCAMAVSSVVILALVSLIGQSTSDYTRAQRAVNSIAQIRSFADFFDNELSTRLPDSSLIISSEDDPHSDKIAFLKVMNAYEEDESNPGDLMGCVYFVHWPHDDAGVSGPVLYRKRLTAPAISGLLGEKEMETGFPAYEVSGSEPMIHHVVGFSMELLYRDESSGELREWTMEMLPDQPTQLDFKLAYLEESTAARFRDKSDWKRLSTNPESHELALIRIFEHSLYLSK
ncbi:PilW family protein [Luteolibacter algae]|uniref:PilW family protein n=1 Tax=Luteolibacter algae TaxID=454151 RepID=A0ABW5D700_9BACT